MAKPYLYEDGAFDSGFSGAFEAGYSSAGGFNPARINDLVIWMDASTLLLANGAPVSMVKDRSPNGNDLTQAGAPRPLFRPTGINGFPSIEFDGVDALLEADNAASLNFTTSFTAYVVIKPTDYTHFNTMFGKSGNKFRMILESSDGSARGIVTGAAIQDTLGVGVTTIDSNVIFEVRWDVRVGGLIEFTKSGVPYGDAVVSTIDTISRDTAKFQVGSAAVGQLFEGQIGQLALYDRLLTLEERNKIGNYFAKEYGLTWTEIVPNPDDIPNLVVWLDAARGVTGSPDVSGWSDQSGHGNDAAQTTAGKRPLFGATAFNNFPALVFDDLTDENMEIAASPTVNLNNSFTFYVAMESITNSADRFIIGHNSPNGYEIFMDFSLSDKVTVIVSDDISQEIITCDTAPTNATDIILEVHYEVGGLVSFSQSGVLLGKIKSNILRNIKQSAAAPLYIGSKDGTDAPFKGQMAQLLLFDRALNLEERNFMVNYLAGRYNLTPTALTAPVPTNFAGLVAWYDAAQGVTPGTADSKTTQWDDQSGEGNDAVQANVLLQPFFREISPFLNDRDAIQFNEGINIVAPADSTLDFAGSFSFFVVTNIRIGNESLLEITFFSKNGDSGYRWKVNAANLPQIIATASTGPAQTITGGTITPLTPIILDLNFTVGGANRVKMSQNGRSIGDFLNKLANIKTTTAPFNIGAFTNEDMEGLIGQILVYDNLLPNAARNAVGEYLAARHRPQTWTPILQQTLPTDIPGLALWLDASFGIGSTPPSGRVSSWADQSGNGFVALQADPAKTPGFNPASLGGQGAVDWPDKLVAYLSGAAPSTSKVNITGSFTFYAVASLGERAPTIIPSNFLARNMNNGYRFRIDAAGKVDTVVADAGSFELDVSTDIVPTGQFHIIEIHFDAGGTINFTLNGVNIGSTSNTLTGVRSSSADLFVGGDGFSNLEHWVGEIGNMLLYDRLLTTTERNRAGLYLSSRYNLPWADVAFKPTDIPNLTFWLDAGVSSSIVLAGNKVSTWTDQTGTPLVATQTTDADRAVFEATGLNGFPTLDFDGVNDQYSIPDNADIDLTSSFTMYVVCRPGDVSTVRTLFSKNGINSYVWSTNTGGTQRFRSEGTEPLQDSTSPGPATIADFESVILEIHYSISSPSGTSMINFTKNGFSMGTVATAATDIFNSSVEARIGAQGAITQTEFFAGKISQILIFKRLLNNQERNAMGNYLGGRYGIPWEDIT